MSSGWARRALRSPELLLWLLGAGFCAVRFVGLERSPPGFFSDEFRGALHQICLSQSGASADGSKWPLFVPGAGGGLYTPAFLYGGALWQAFWGPSIATFRALAAVAGLATTLGVTVLAHRLGGARMAAWTFAAASLSPWAFQFSRIAWDPPLAPAFLVWAIVLWLQRSRPWRALLAGACFSLALYSYPPTRLQAPAIFALLGGWALYRRGLRLRHALHFAGAAILIALPLLKGTVDGSLNGRGSAEAIFAPDFLARHRGLLGPAHFAGQSFLDNFAAHFRPSFLLLSGDQNLRHSTGSMGLVGALEVVALGVVALGVGKRALLRSGVLAIGATPVVRAADETTVRRWRVAGFALFAYAAGVLPAALCWSGVPHALRSIGSWPFLALLTGLVLSHAVTFLGQKLRNVALVAACVHGALFLWVYFVRYPPASASWFDVELHRALSEPAFDRARKFELVTEYPEAFRLHRVFRGESCAGSAGSLERWLADPNNRPPPKRKRR